MQTVDMGYGPKFWLAVFDRVQCANDVGCCAGFRMPAAPRPPLRCAGGLHSGPARWKGAYHLIGDSVRLITFRTHASQQIASLFDHFVGAIKQRLWHGDAERLSGLEIDEQFDFACLLDR
jgi:hypothetical protein